MKQGKNRSEALIAAACPLFACRVCRTKTGWKHQRWCACASVLAPGCRDCRYWEPERKVCVHPARKKEVLSLETDPDPV